MYKLFEDHQITQGFQRDLLVDFTRQKIAIIPKSVTTVIEKLGSNWTPNDNEINIIQELLDEEIIFEISSEELDLFPAVNLDWDYPAEISNSIIEISHSNIKYLKDVFIELEELNCFHYSVILMESFNDQEIEIIKGFLFDMEILSFHLAINYYPSDALNSLLTLTGKSTRMKSKITVYNCDDHVFMKRFGELISLRTGLYSSNRCGCISKENFTVNFTLYTESQKFNTCLNRKIGIDSFGNIKNCPASKESFGKIGQKSIKKIVQTRDFQAKWQIKKDEITVCKDCEFRHICVDCRALLEDPDDSRSKP